MLMLHISDIHFKSPDCLDPLMDPELPIRTRMMRDLTEQVQKLGNVGAILIGEISRSRQPQMSIGQPETG